jgi:hypothetical protein
MRQPVTWVGRTNFRVPTETEELGVEPNTQELDTRRFDKAYLVTPHIGAKMRPFVQRFTDGSQAKFDDYTEKTWVERWMSVVVPAPSRGGALVGENCICL